MKRGSEVPLPQEFATFGELFRAYRKSENLGLRKTARLLRVAHSTIAQLEAGTRIPPYTKRGRSFYEKLKTLPGMNEHLMDSLLGAAGRAAPVLTSEEHPTNPTPNRSVVIASSLGIHAITSLEFDPNVYSPEEVGILSRFAKLSLTLTFGNYLAHREEIQRLVFSKQEPS